MHEAPLYRGSDGEAPQQRVHLRDWKTGVMFGSWSLVLGCKVLRQALV